MYHNRVALNFSNVEHETLAQLFQNVNSGENPVTFSSQRLPDTNPDAIAIHQVFQGMTFSFDVNKEERNGGHPAWLSTNNRVNGSISYEQIVQEPDRNIVRRESARMLSAAHSNPHYLYFLGLNLFENPRIQDFNGRRPLKYMHKSLSHKEAQLLFYFCTAKCYLLGKDLFYLCFCYINNEALNNATEEMSMWLLSEDGMQVVENLNNTQYTSQYLDPLFRLVASPIAAKLHVDIEKITSFP